jgi:hypothetical protein
VSDPLGVARQVMTALGHGADAEDEAAFAACVAENARENRPRHKYTAEQFGLTPELIARDFAFYHEQYL